MTERRKDYMDLAKLYDTIDTIKTKQTEIATDVTYIKAAIDRHNHLIDGNGQKGCMGRLTSIESAQDELSKSTNRRFKGINWILTISASILIACFTVIWERIPK